MTDTSAKWQPMKTAPTDGTVVDLWVQPQGREGARIPEMKYQPGDQTMANDWHDEAGAFSLVGDRIIDTLEDVTHWRSRPPSPEVEAANE